MNIVGITGKSGSGKSYFSKKLGENLNKSKIVTLDHIFFELINNDEEIKKNIVDKYGERAYNKHQDIDLNVLQKDENCFQYLFKTVEKTLNRKINEIVETEKNNNQENLIFDWFMLPYTDAYKKANFNILVEPESEERYKNLLSRDKSYTKEVIEKKDRLLNIDYLNYNFDMVVRHNYIDEDLNNYISKANEYLKNQNKSLKKYNPLLAFFSKISNKINIFKKKEKEKDHENKEKYNEKIDLHKEFVKNISDDGRLRKSSFLEKDLEVIVDNSNVIKDKEDKGERYE